MFAKELITNAINVFHELFTLGQHFELVHHNSVSELVLAKRLYFDNLRFTFINPDTHNVKLRIETFTCC